MLVGVRRPVARRFACCVRNPGDCRESLRTAVECARHLHVPSEGSVRIQDKFRTIAVVVLVACAGGDGVQPPDHIVELTATQSALVPGETTSLVAVVKGPDGAPRPGALVTFSSSDPNVASVSGNGVVSALAAGNVTIRAQSGGATAQQPIRVDEGGLMSSAGGTIRGLSGAVELVVPAGAVTSPVAIRLATAGNPLLDPTAVPGSIYTVSPSTVQFQLPATVRIWFGTVGAPFGLPPEQLRVRDFSQGAWMALPNGSGDGVARVASGELRTGGLLSVGWVPPASPCTSAESRQFDFWLGRWNATLAGVAAGTSEITLAPGGCAVLEHFVSNGVGRSISFYVPTAHRWYQTYIDNSGARVELEGELVNGGMDLRTPNWDARAHGLTRWTREGANVRQRAAMLSTNGGASYGPPQYDFLYVPR